MVANDPDDTEQKPFFAGTLLSKGPAGAGNLV